MTRFNFEALCTCGGTLRELTSSAPNMYSSSSRVVCTSCAVQWDLSVTLSPHRNWSEQDARRAASEAMADMGAGN